MKISDMLLKKKFVLSFEVFPPVKDGNIESLFSTIRELEELKPDFISVTYGAGGSTRDKSIEIASKVKNEFNKEVLAHLTCVQTTKDDILGILDEFKKKNIENILALRGDPPKGETEFVKTEGGFGYANELVEFIKSNDGFSIGVAGYPEGHIEAPSLEADLINLKRKVDAGADFIITQLFFNNGDFYRFRDSTIKTGIRVPIIPGIFPILNYKQVYRIASLCGAKIPSRLEQKIYKLKEKPDEIEKYGIEYATIQAEDLIKNDVDGLHIYSMNKSYPAKQIVAELPYPR
ncbi:MAG: methylenetetrahydrofolate reductase [NAD(P)H] [Proteobacteria bacterium]|nr:methylenetetrahydrofolate reductase [NAD(P)H] [Pseudomonadota bacterium]